MYRDDVRRHLESPSCFDSTLAALRDSHCELRPFANASDLLHFLRCEDEDADGKNGPLLALICEYQASRNSDLFSLLLAVMFPMLNALYASRARGGSPMQRDEIWSEIVFAFAEAVMAYPVTRRMSRVAANLRGETLRGLRRMASAEVRESEARERLASDLAGLDDSLGVDSVAGGENLISWNALLGASLERVAPTVMDMADALHQIKVHVSEGKLTEGEAAVVRGVLVGRSLIEVARDLGITWNAAKLRSSRALRALRCG